MQWFGIEPFAPMCDDLDRVPVPIGEPCAWCGELVGSGDQGFYLGGCDQPTHQECFIRQVVGSVAHQQRRCSCYGGVGEDVGALRAAARAAMQLWLETEARDER